MDAPEDTLQQLGAETIRKMLRRRHHPLNTDAQKQIMLQHLTAPLNNRQSPWDYGRALPVRAAKVVDA